MANDPEYDKKLSPEENLARGRVGVCLGMGGGGAGLGGALGRDCGGGG